MKVTFLTILNFIVMNSLYIGMQSLSYILFGTSIFGRIIGCILHFVCYSYAWGSELFGSVCIVIFLCYHHEC